jgi:hypothetical protein
LCPILVGSCHGLGALYIALLRGLVTSAEEQQGVALAHEINPVAGPHIDPKFADPFAHEPAVSEMSESGELETKDNPRPNRRIA